MTETRPRRWLSGLLFALSGVATAAMFGFWFAATWTHGHDAATRTSATGFLAALVAGTFAVLGVMAWSAKR